MAAIIGSGRLEERRLRVAIGTAVATADVHAEDFHAVQPSRFVRAGGKAHHRVGASRQGQG